MQTIVFLMQNIFDTLNNNYWVFIYLCSILIGLYYLHYTSIKQNLNSKFFFDKFFQILILGFILGKLIFVAINWNLFQEYEWSILPFATVYNSFNGLYETNWFINLPWIIFTPNLSQVNAIGYLIAIWGFSIYRHIKYDIKYLYITFTIALSFIPLLLGYIFTKYIDIYVFETIELNSLININLFLFSIVAIVFVLWLNYLFMLKKQYESELLKSSRTDSYDVVKEIANWARLKKFTVTRQNNGIKNANEMKEAQSDFDRIWKKLNTNQNENNSINRTSQS